MSGLSNLYLIQTNPEVATHIPVIVTNGANLYRSILANLVSAFPLSERDNGVFIIKDSNLTFVKTQHTTGGVFVEIHRVTGESGFKEYDLQTITAFTLAEADPKLGSFWAVDTSGLYQIKSSNTVSGNIEVLHAPESNYLIIDWQLVTPIPGEDRKLGVFTIFEKNLYFIKFLDTSSSFVEVHVFYESTKYQSGARYITPFQTGEWENGTWEIGLKGDLYFVKTAKVEKGFVEVHIAQALGDYSKVISLVTVVSEVEGRSGVFDVD